MRIYLPHEQREKNLVEAVREMRGLQKRFFLCRDGTDRAWLLPQCKAAERDVDRLLQQYAVGEEEEGGLFDE